MVFPLLGMNAYNCKIAFKNGTPSVCLLSVRTAHGVCLLPLRTYYDVELFMHTSYLSGNR